MDGTGRSAGPSTARPGLLRAADRAAPWALAVLVALASVPTLDDLRRPAVLVTALAASWASLVARHRFLPVLVVGAVGWTWLGLWPAVVVASYYAGARPRRWWPLAAYVLPASLLVAAPALVPPLQVPRSGPGAGNAVALAGLLVLLPVVAGMWVGARRRVVEGLRERSEQLERERVVLAERERAVERARIAREMHDVVAHRVSLMVVQAGALEVSAPDASTVEAAGAIRALGREALTDLRDVLGVLRQPGDVTSLAPPPGLADLDRLLEQSRAAGTAVTRRDDGTPGGVPAAVQTTAYRVVQEGLANVHRHAAGAPACVRLDHRAGHLEVHVVNARPSPGARPGLADEPMPSSGHGLTGLRERLALLGGDLDAGPRPDGGFGVSARIPHASPGDAS